MTCRYWINQPSTLQPLHKLHGERVIVLREDYPGTVTIAFLRGNIETALVSKLCLSTGWPGAEQEENVDLTVAI